MCQQSIRKDFNLVVSRCFLFFLFTMNGLCAITATSAVKNKYEALTYLTEFGYVEGSKTKGNLLSEDFIAKALKEFQRFAGINETGTLDEETLTMMNTPRCGVKDKIGFGADAKRKKRYALQGSKWRVTDLTYRISKYPSAKLTRSQVDEEIKKAFKVWSDFTNLKFTQKQYGSVHIDIRFVRREHGDGDPFDGIGGTLAHAYFPIYGGDAHFDDEERWTINSYSGSNLFQVAAHEFGHSLGLSHSDVQQALMAPFYRGYVSNFKLHHDDIKAIQSLYGTKKPERPHPSKPGTTNRPGSPTDGESGQEGELCSDSTIDAVFSVGKKSFVFKGEYYWEVASEGLEDGYPQPIKRGWPGLPTPIDAAFTFTNGKTYFFKDDLYWRYDGKKMDKDYPKRISEGFSGIPSNVNAAFLWSGNDKIYFFKGSKYWKYDLTRKPPVSSDYPKAISLWTGIPNDIDAAFQYTNGFTYFFKGIYYWRFNDRRFKVDFAEPSFPRPSAPWWFGCKAMPSDNKGLFPSAGLKDDTSDELEVEDKDDAAYDYQQRSAELEPKHKENGADFILSGTIFTVVVSLMALWL